MRLVSIDGKKLAGLRQQKGLSQRQLAEASGISADYISRIERGRVGTVTTETRAALAAALVGDDPQFVVTDTGRATLARVTEKGAREALGKLNRRRAHGRLQRIAD